MPAVCVHVCVCMYAYLYECVCQNCRHKPCLIPGHLWPKKKYLCKAVQFSLPLIVGW